MSQNGLSGAVIYAKDPLRLAAFYASVATIAQRSDHDGYSVVGDGPGRLIFVRIPDHIASRIEITTPPERRENTPIKLLLRVDDLASARERAQAQGGALAPADREWIFENDRVCDGHDPEGNVFQLHARL